MLRRVARSAVRARHRRHDAIVHAELLYWHCTMARDYYEVLGVTRGASDDDIRKAHRRLAKDFHPDRNKSPEAGKRFSEVQEAYDTLSDPQKRKAYDRFGHAGTAGSPFGGGPSGAGGPWQNVNPEDLEDMLGGLGGIGDFLRGSGGVGSRGRTGRTGRSAARAGSNVELETTVDFTTAAVGGVRSVTLRNSEDGKPTTFDVRIPPGVATGSLLRIAGRGSHGIGGGPAGDLVLHIQVAPHPHFRRDGLDILIDVPITIAEASLGTKVSVPLLKGTVDVRVPAGTSSGKRVRVPGKGVAPPNKSPGDFYAVIQIVAPPSLSDQDQSALREIGERLPNPREGLW